MARMFARLLLLLAILFGVSLPTSGAETVSPERQKIPTSLFVDSMAGASRDDDAKHSQLAASSLNSHHMQPSARPLSTAATNASVADVAQDHRFARPNRESRAAGHPTTVRQNTLYHGLKPFVSKEVVSSFRPATFGFLNGAVHLLTANFASFDADANLPNLYVRGELEQSISDSWSRLQRGENASNKIDPYWEYYSDCDRWNVVFANAITDETPLQGFSVVAATVDQLNSLRQWICSGISPLENYALEFARQLEFNVIESQVYVASGQQSAMIHELQHQIHAVAHLTNRLSKHSVRSLGFFNNRVIAFVDTAPNRYQVRLQQRRETDSLRRFVAPRLSWMASHLQQVADQLDYANHEASKEAKIWK